MGQSLTNAGLEHSFFAKIGHRSTGDAFQRRPHCPPPQAPKSSSRFLCPGRHEVVCGFCLKLQSSLTSYPTLSSSPKAGTPKPSSLPGQPGLWPAAAEEAHTYPPPARSRKPAKPTSLWPRSCTSSGGPGEKELLDPRIFPCAPGSRHSSS